MSKSKLKILHLLICGVAAAVLGGCAMPRYRGAGNPIATPGVLEQYQAIFESRYPAQYRLKQRLALRALGKQYDMLGYLVMQPDGSFRAVALGEMGGRIFDLALEQGQPKIYKKPDKMPPRPLLEGVIGDIRHLYGVPAPVVCRTAGVSVDSGVTISIRGKGRAFDDYSFRIQDHVPTHSLESNGRRVLREAEYLEYRRLAGFERPVPTRIVLKNHRWHYTLEIQTLEIIPGPPGGMK